MLRLARICFVIPSVAFVGMGALHIVTHLLVFAGKEARGGLQGVPDIDVYGTAVPVWNIWQAQSLLVGVFCLGLGVSNLAGLFAQPKDSYPAEAVCLTGVFVLVAIFLMGLLHTGPVFVAGAPVGILMFLVAAIVSRVAVASDSD